jgi:uncharacterized protein (TIGR02001 family)
MKTKVSRAGVALVALLATAGTAMAEGEWSGNVAMTSDYVWRGVSQSNEDPAIQGGFDYANGSFYAAHGHPTSISVTIPTPISKLTSTAASLAHSRTA